MTGTAHLEWWQVPAARADLERILVDLDALRSSHPESETAYFCDLCEILTGLLATGARCAVTPEEDQTVHELRTRLDRQLASTTYVDQGAIETLEKLEELLIAALLAKPQHKLAIYGTLAPGEVNHSQIAGIPGTWAEGFVRGDVSSTGWGSEYGFPALTWRPDGPRVPVKLFVAPELEQHWPRLDEFEGESYGRILVPVDDDDDGILAVANIYVDKATVKDSLASGD